MAKKDIKTELQELIQYIKTNYQEEVDFIIPYLDKENKIGAIDRLSPKLKKYLREWFNIPAGVNDHLDYSRGDWEQEGKRRFRYYYRVEGDGEGSEFEGLYWYNPHYKLEQEKPENCVACGKLTLEEEGRFWVWNKDYKNKGFEEKLRCLSYLHLNCAKKYFANQKQPSQNEVSRIKEKLLRHLDRLSLDPIGNLANAESLKRNDIEELYRKGGDSNFKIIVERVYKVEIEDEKVDLDKLEEKVKLTIRKAIIQEIKQNPQNWKIEECNIKALNNAKILKHKSGRKHWNFGIIYFNESLEKGKQDWAEIEVLINGSDSPVTPNNQPKNPLIELTSTEKETIRKYMENQGITSLFLVGNQLIVEYKNKPSQRLAVDNSELQNIQKCLEKTADKSLNYEQISNNSNSTNQPKSPNYTPLWISLSVGGGIALGILAIYLVSKVRKSKK